jgi:alkanesulfonate monooxygenase SsuD/methylene tetrahydromethanopterin reductase-like flavin-dependent oxidoreductase (luciferase family)
MEFGLMTEPQLGMTYDELLGAARFAERIGLSVFARSDHYDFPRIEPPHATEAFATLGGLARETARIELCVLVSPITFRHPGVVAKMVATIDEMSGGRLLIGVGTGWMQEEHDLLGLPFPDLSERFDRLEESLAYLRAAFSGGSFSGEYYALADREVRPLPTNARIVVGGSGPKRTPRLAGTFADEFNVAFAPPEEIETRVARATQAAAAAGRDPETLKISVMGGAITGTDDASFRANLEQIAAADPFGRGPDDLESRFRERGMPVGPAAEAREALARLTDAGVQRFYLQHFGPFDEDLMEQLFEALRG